jgi:hypothetical protein
VSSCEKLAITEAIALSLTDVPRTIGLSREFHHARDAKVAHPPNG